MHRPAVELAISRSRVRRPNHHTTEPPNVRSTKPVRRKLIVGRKFVHIYARGRLERGTLCFFGRESRRDGCVRAAALRGVSSMQSSRQAAVVDNVDFTGLTARDPPSYIVGESCRTAPVYLSLVPR